MAMGARPVSTSVRSWFCAAGPPTRAVGTAAPSADRGGSRRALTSPESSTGGRADHADDDPAVGSGRGNGAGVHDPGDVDAIASTRAAASARGS